MRMGAVALLVMAIACAILAPPASADPPESMLDPVRKQLRAHGYDATAYGLRKYFADIQGTVDDRRQIGEWIEMLGAPHYRVRESAMRDLLHRALTQPQLVTQMLRDALESRDHEVQFRAKWLLARHGASSTELLSAALRLISEEPVEGLAAEVASVWPCCVTEDHKSRFAPALAATSRIEDRELLVQLLNEPEKIVNAEAATRHRLQVAAVEALRGLLKQKSVALIAPQLNNRHDAVRLAAALATIDYEPLPALDTLIQLLESDLPLIRDRAFVVLRQVTGQEIWLNAYGDRAARRSAAKRWREWFQQHGKVAKLALPLDESSRKQQRLLLSMFNPKQVLHCTIGGERLGEATQPSTPSACVRKPDGGWLVAEWGANGFCELDASGKLVARHKLGANPNGLELLPNGNVLVALFNDNKVMEVTVGGKKVWELEVQSGPTDVRYLPNGNHLVALHGTRRLIELNAKRQVVWSLGGLPQPESARPLPNGNLLIASAEGVAEFTREGRIVWESGHEGRAYDAVFLDNGNVLVADRAEGLFEYTREGKLVRKVVDGCVRRIHYY